MKRFMEKKRLAIIIVAFLLVIFAGLGAQGETVPRTRYEMDIFLNEDVSSHPRLDMDVWVTFFNDSAETWNEVCFRDFMSSVYQCSWELSGCHSAIKSASQNGIALDIRVEPNYNPILNAADASVVFIVLDTPLAPGESTTIALEYIADIPEETLRCSYNSILWSVEGSRTYELAQFYPMLAVFENGAWDTNPYFTEGECFYTRCADYSVTLHTPERYSVIASGTETSGATDAGMTQWQIEAESMRDMSIIISNEYQMMSGVSCGVTVNSYYVPNDASDPGNDHEKQGALQLQAALDAIEAFTAAYGPYPYGELDVVESNYCFGGMESPGLVRVSQMYSWFISESDSAEDQHEYADKCAATTAHEVAHEWFYAVVGNNQFDEAWLDESFAAFSEQVYWRHVGRSEAEVAAAMKPFIEDVPASGDMSVDRSYAQLNSDLYFDYTSAVYQRGAGFLYQLEQSMGTDSFYTFMKDYYAAWSFKEAHTTDFMNALLPFIKGNSAARALVKKYLSQAAGML